MIGAGYFAGFHAEAWQRITDVEIVGVVDPLLERAQEFASEWNIKRVYQDAEELFSKHALDFVDLATRPETHLELTWLAAGHNVNIICQKPMAPSWEECLQMVKAAEQQGVRLLMHENWRWQPWYRQMKRLLEDQKLGKVFYLGYRMRSGDGRGENPYKLQPYFRQMKLLLVYETIIHFLDTFRYLEGEFESLFCQMTRVNPVLQGEDCAVVQLAFQSGARGVIDANRISGPPALTLTLGECRLEGEEATLRLSEDGRLWLKRYDQDEIQHPYELPEYGYRGNSVEATQRHCVDALRSGSRCESEGRDYLKTMEAVFACYRSAQNNCSIDLTGQYEL